MSRQPHRRIGLLAWLLIPASLTAAGVTTRLETWHDAARNRDVPIKIYLPADGPTPAPVVVFSPGLGGSRTGYSYLGESWAGHGYAVLVLEHVGSNLPFLIGGPATIKTATSSKEFIARVADVHFAIDQLEQLNRSNQDPLFGKLDLAHLAMAGHSYGAITTQAIAGQTYAGGGKLADPRVKCAIIMSPSPPAVPRADAFDPIALPMLHLTGTLDDSPIGGATAKDRREPFDRIKAGHQTLVTFTDADHMVFSGSPRFRPEKAKLDGVLHPLIETITLKFLDANLRSDPAAAKWLENDLKPAVGSSGVVEQK